MEDREDIPEYFHPYLDRIDEAWHARREAIRDRMRRRAPLFDDDVARLEEQLRKAEEALKLVARRTP